MIELDLRPDRRRLAQFGGLAFVAFGAVALQAFVQGRLLGFDLGESAATVRMVLLAVAGFSGVSSLIWPPANRPLYTLMTVLAFPIGLVVSHVLMGVLFYVFITPVGLFFRWIGRDPLCRRFDPDSRTYWVEHRQPKSPARYFRQF